MQCVFREIPSVKLNKTEISILLRNKLLPIDQNKLKYVIFSGIMYCKTVSEYNKYFAALQSIVYKTRLD